MRKKLLTGFLASALGLASIVSGQQPPYSPSNPFQPKSATTMTNQEKQIYVNIATKGNNDQITIPKNYESVLVEIDIVPVLCMLSVNEKKNSGTYKLRPSDTSHELITIFNSNYTPLEYLNSMYATEVSGNAVTFLGIDFQSKFQINYITTRPNRDIIAQNQNLTAFTYKGVAAGKAISIDTKLENRRPIESTGKWGSLDVTVAYVQDDKFPQFNKSKTVKIGTDVYRVDFSIGKQNDVLTYTGFAIEKTN